MVLNFVSDPKALTTSEVTRGYELVCIGGGYESSYRFEIRCGRDYFRFSATRETDSTGIRWFIHNIGSYDIEFDGLKTPDKMRMMLRMALESYAFVHGTLKELGVVAK